MKKSAQDAQSMAPTSAKSLENAQQQASRAAEAMSQAKQQLAKAAQAGKPTPKQEGETQKQQQEAVRNLEEARKQLAKTHEQLDLKRREQEIFELEKVLAGILAGQVTVRQATEQLATATEAGRKPFTHAQKLRGQQLVEQQGSLYKQCGDLVIRLQKGNVPVFHYVLADSARMMVDVQKLLRGGDVGWLTQETQRDIERNLTQLLGALKQEGQRLAKARQQRRPAGGAGGQRPDKPAPLVPPLAQLKQLQALQAIVNEKTRALEVDKRTQLTRRQRLFQRRAQRLAQQQQELGRIAKDFADALEADNTQEQMAPP